MEHDSHSGALRDREFLAQAQVLADDCRQSDELFSLVVFTLRGFRHIFTNDSQQWRILSGIVGRCLNSVLSSHRDNCLLGKMADDVFAIMLRRSDEFLARSTMQKAADQLRVAMEKDRDVDMLEVMAVEFQWALADYKQYQGNVEQLLNKIYRRLFCQSQNKSEQIHQIVWEKQGDKVG
jgi:GGDEF domain-containing protein